jgi:benzoyl-CoA reductase/2-hydroxyglutaryl-CoA dehydratase subunit BcrC/BadD/HgdB
MNGATSEMSKATRSLEAVRNAKKFLPSFYNRGGQREGLAWCMHAVPTELLLAFDIACEWPENFGALCAARHVATTFIDVAGQDGYPGELCSYLTTSSGYCRRCAELGRVPPESPLAEGMGVPEMLLGSTWLCEPRYKWLQATATRYFRVPVFCTDPLSPPFDADIRDPRIADHYVSYLLEELKSLVAFLEKHTGRKLDPYRLRRAMETSQQSLKHWYETLELRKARPCPMGSEDYFTCIVAQLYMLGTAEALDFFENVHREVERRVQQRVGVLSEERFRLHFAGIPPWYNLGFFNYLETKGAIGVFESTYYPGPPVEVDLDDPIVGLAQRIWKKACWSHAWGSEAVPEMSNPGTQQVVGSGFLLQAVQEYGIDGAIMHRTRSCRAVSWGQTHYRNILEKEGIPCIIFESDMADPRNWSDSRIKALVEPFLETLRDARQNRA